MIILAIVASLAAIGALCWLLFTLAVFALPAFVGATVGAWAHEAGAGIPGAILIGLFAAAATLAVGQLVIMFVRPVWLKLIVAIVFVAPAAIAGFHATHGIVKHLMPSEAWQITFSVIGAIAVGITALVWVAGMAAAQPRLARASRRPNRAQSPCGGSEQRWLDSSTPSEALADGEWREVDAGPGLRPISLER
jgi:hypothetical protein